MVQDKNKRVTIPGELHSAATGNVVAPADEIYDYGLDKRQSDLNKITDDSPSYNVSKHHPNHEVVIDGSTVVTNRYSFDEAVQLVPESLRVGGLKLSFISYSSEFNSYILKTENWSTDIDNWSSVGGLDVFELTDNPEYIDVKTDNEGKIIESIGVSGVKDINVPVNINGSANVNGSVYVEGPIDSSGFTIKEIENPEFIKVLLDAYDRVICGIKKDGSFYASHIEGIDEQIQEKIDEFEQLIQEIEDDIDEKVKVFNELFEYIDDPEERLQIIMDSSSKIISYRKSDGTLVEPTGIETQNISIGENTLKSIKDPEERTQITIDDGGRVISYRKSDGTLVENVSIETPEINLSKDGLDKLSNELNIPLPEKAGIYKSPNIPKYGVVNMKSETFYLEYNPNAYTIDQVIPIQDYEDNQENNDRRMSRAHYYIKSTLTINEDGTYSINENSIRLMHFASEKVHFDSASNMYFASTAVTRINGICYYADTLINSVRWSPKNTVLPGYTVEAPNDDSILEGQYKMVDLRVSKMVGVPCLMAWNVEAMEAYKVEGTDIGEKMAHECVVDVDFGEFFYKEDYYVTIKHQGRVTNSFAKRGYRFTPYKASDYKKKDKIKIGELIRLSKYNMKAYPYGVIEVNPILNRLMVDIWNTRPITDRYDWDGGSNGYFHGATGNMRDFPMRLEVDGEFYGIYYFGLPKDEKNCILSGEDSDGMYLQGSTNGSNCWGKNLPYDVRKNYDDEQGAYKDEHGNEVMSPETAAAMENWTHFMQERLYKGSDDNEYNITQLTDVDGKYYVTSTLVDGNPTQDSISAKLIKVNRESVNLRIDVLGFIDYLICLQVFKMSDNFHNNMIIYSNSEKRKLWPFFYDMNDAFSRKNEYDEDYIEVKRESGYDLSVWDLMTDLFWDDIVNRYHSLRNTVLTKDYINDVYSDIVSEIPDVDYENESSKWNRSASKNSFSSNVEFIANRLDWLDYNYFK